MRRELIFLASPIERKTGMMASQTMNGELTARAIVMGPTARERRRETSEDLITRRSK
jgi:hypothetical protein